MARPRPLSRPAPVYYVNQWTSSGLIGCVMCQTHSWIREYVWELFGVSLIHFSNKQLFLFILSYRISTRICCFNCPVDLNVLRERWITINQATFSVSYIILNFGREKMVFADSSFRHICFLKRAWIDDFTLLPVSSRRHNPVVPILFYSTNNVLLLLTS